MTANTLLAKPLEETDGELTPLREVFEAERGASMGQWLRKQGMQSYAKAFMDAGLTTVDEALAARDLTSEEAMSEFGVKNKKHAKKLSKLAKAKAKKAKSKKCKQEKSKDDL